MVTGNYRCNKTHKSHTKKLYHSRSPVREEPQHTYTCSKPCQPDCTRQVAGQGRATIHIHTQQTLPARPHSAGRRSGKSQNTHIHAANPQACQPDRTRQVASQGRATIHMHTQQILPARPHSAGRRSGKSHNTHEPCRPDRTRQVAGQGRATTHMHTQQTLPARPHSAGRRSGKSHNTHAHAAKPACQTTLGRSPVREEPQYTYSRSKTCRPDRTQQVAGQGRATIHIHMQ